MGDIEHPPFTGEIPNTVTSFGVIPIGTEAVSFGVIDDPPCKGVVDIP
jgi:hypothetical protein